MDFPLMRAVVRPIEDEGKIVGWRYIRSDKTITQLKECAITRLYTVAQQQGRMSQDDIVQVAFVDEEGNQIPTIDKNRSGLDMFLQKHPDLHIFAINQHMSEVGKILLSKYPVRETLSKMYSPEWAAQIDTHKWLKVAQIACQPGIIWGDSERTLEPWELDVYVDEKRPDEDGIIYVSPQVWPELMSCYLPVMENKNRKLSKTELEELTLIKVNSSNPQITIKGVFMRADVETWKKIVERSGGKEFQILLCGNAIKDNHFFKEGEVYKLGRDYFAYHADSSMHRGTRINVSKQILTRSLMDTSKFLDLAIAPAIDRLSGLMKFDEDHVLRAIGAFSKEGEETTLETAAAIKKRIVDHGLPANHPANALQVWRLGMTIIRERLARVDIEGFHGMGAPSPYGTGKVAVPGWMYRAWMRRHGTNEAYLFRMPYLGSYCGRTVKLVPARTDTIMVNWEDALKMEGDFDGDQYFVVPSKYISCPAEGQKPFRPAKGTKDELELTKENLTNQVVTLATNKLGIGPRDYLLNIAYDYYHEAVAQGDEEKTILWQSNIEKLQVYEQQAIEGLKHSSEMMLTDKDLKEMFPNGPQPHVYTQLLANKSMRTYSLQSNRPTVGYIEAVRNAVDEKHAWHPLHGIFTRVATLEFGEIADIMPYWKAIEGRRIGVFGSSVIKQFYRDLRDLHKMYSRLIAKWNGGRNKNVSFGQDVLEPIRKKFSEMLALYPEDKYPGSAYAIHLMLAQVAYEPQPNWEMTGTRERNGHDGLLTRLAKKTRNLRALSEMEGKQLTIKVANKKYGKLVRVKPYHHRPLLRGTVKSKPNRFTFSIHKWLPRPGSLFHHLADAELARLILDSALEKISRDDLLRMLVGAIRVS